MTYNVLLVDDDKHQLAFLKTLIEKDGNFCTKSVNNGQEAIDVLTSERDDKFDLVLLDLSMPGVDGVNVVNAVRPIKPDLPIVICTGNESMNMAVNAMKAGATDLVSKLDNTAKLKEKINSSIKIKNIESKIEEMKKDATGRISFASIIGDTKPVKEMIELGKKVAQSDIPVLIEGESGSGKELLAHSIHAESSRSQKPFVAVNCGAIPENLVESILFGHEKGSFTGALYKTFGKFREADGGTIFLDEVGELTPDIQVKLLRVLQNGEIDPVGSNKPTKVNVRVISATNKNLFEEVKGGNFREDLYYRLNVFPINIPPLRDRNGDISKMVDYFIKLFALSENKEVNGISSEAEKLIESYNWPGNIRQLKNIIYRAVVLSEKDKLGVEDFPQISQMLSLDDDEFGDQSFNDSLLFVPLLDRDGGLKDLAKIESDVIQAAIDYHNKNLSQVAKSLKLGRSTLYRKLKEYGLN